MARGKLAATRGAGNRDPWAGLTSSTQTESNQVQFTKPGPDSSVSVKAEGEAQFGANTKGTGTEGVPTSVALRNKRRLGLKMPANF